MVLRNPPLAEPEKYPGGVKVRPPFEMGVVNLTDYFLQPVYGQTAVLNAANLNLQLNRSRL